MLVLHGTYDHGRVKIKDKDKPAIKQDVQIILESNSGAEKENLRSFFAKYQFDLSKFRFNRDEANER